ncbi:sulfatase family protein [Horticoccus sp. 23ND18S-11]|uniref:sulfatase family protein n=1 Tax=Horticoccus sp. 23ND18S-11 TaxID=3391832 RepID=UPI0039C8FD93
MPPLTSPRIRLCLLVALLLTVFAAPGRAADRPNIVILYADDMGYGDLAIQNPGSRIRTPHLDQLAREGLRFTDAHSSSGICSPSRYALLTGRFHWRKFHAIVQSFGPSVFDAAELTLPEMLKQRGYRTACIGKWHLGWNWDAIKRPGAKPDPKTGYAPDAFDWSRPIPGGPRDQGFDYYFGDDVPNFPPYTWFENDRVMTVPNAPLTLTPTTAEGTWEARPGPMVAGWDFHAVMPRLTERAVNWIQEQRNQKEPFFLYFPFTSPHAPIVPTPEFAGKSKAGGYGDFMEQTDATVGRVLAALAANGFAENTLVIFTADNGPEHYAYPRIQNFEHRSSGPLRGVKRDLWEGGHRVPFVVRWPGIVPKGEISNALISQVDLMATLAAITGFTLPAGTADDSHDLLPVWKSRAPSPRHAIVHNTNANGYAIRQDQWLLVAARTGAVTKVPAWFDPANGYAAHDQPGELYDLSRDLAQKTNRYSDEPARVAAMTALLAQIRAKGQVR